MRVRFLLSALLLSALCCSANAAGKARHVVVIVWDGMRPDFVSESNTPTLYRLSGRGVTFLNQHPVYLSSTEVNGTALATGSYPEHDGIVGNKEYFPDMAPTNSVHTEELDVVRRGDQLNHGHYVQLPTLAELVRQSGRKTAVAGAKGVALLLDRMERSNTDLGATVYAGRTLPQALESTLVSRYGKFPAATATNPTRDDWTTLALVDSLWADGVPALSMLWMNEPDHSQHATGPGSDLSLAAIRNNDDNLARVLRALDEKGARDSTDVLIVSDHGFSTVSAAVDLPAALKQAGFQASANVFEQTPKPGDVLDVQNSGSSLLYVVNHDENVISGLVKFLAGWTNSGVIFTRKAMPGTFALAQVGLDRPEAPDIVVSMRWTADKSDIGTPGMIVSDSPEYTPGHGTHVTLSPFDMHNTLIAAGPDFRPGLLDSLASGNVDVAPTVLWILGLKRPSHMDGRVLTEALTGESPPIKKFELGRLDASYEGENFVWRQYLNYTEVNGVRYCDQGNGSQTPK
jgi:arylsulfatase A-like enzyme